MKLLRNRCRATPQSGTRPTGAFAFAFAITASVALAACTAGEAASEHNIYVWPLADILHSLENGEKLGAGPNQVLPDGIRPDSIITDAPDGKKQLRVEPAFAEERTAAYVTTDVWLNLPQVWLQPAYVQIENFSETPIEVPNAPILIDVEHKSLFYSPFWTVELAVVGPGSLPDRFQSTRALLDARPAIPIHPAGWWNYPITPQDFFSESVDARQTDPTWGFALDLVSWREARFDGQQLFLLDLGPATFNASGTGLVEALPFFVFAKRNSEGALTSIGAPRVAGVGPLWSGRTATLTQNPSTLRDEPRLGMFWLLVVAALPASADAFHSAGHPGAVAAAAAANVDVRELEGRVAMSASCFDDVAFPRACNWLDSQARIEGALGSTGVISTKLTMNSTFVSLDRAPVAR